MDDVVARCPDCGNEEARAFPSCAVCGRAVASRWWCHACGDWLAGRPCPVCGGGVGVPAELALGACVVGASVAFKIAARNPGKRSVTCTVSSPDAGVAVANPRLVVPAGGTAELRGAVRLPAGPLGPRTFLLRFDGSVPTETLLVVEAAAPAPRLEFVPSPVAISTSLPGSTVRTAVTLKNIGNVPLIAKLSGSAPWLAVEPRRAELAPGEALVARLKASSRRTDTGTLEGEVRAEAGGETWTAGVRFALPAPQLAADPVAFGELAPGSPAFVEVVLRNTGRVRVACRLTAAHPWLQVRPSRVNLPPGREKKLRARAVLNATHDGPQNSELVVSSATGVVLRVPANATGKIPKALLRAVRKQRVRDVIGPPVERQFRVANDGDARLECAATADRPWIQIVTPVLKVGPGKKRKLRYVLDLPVLPRGEHSATITLTSNGGTATVPLTVHVLDPNPVLEVVAGPDLGLVTPDLPLSVFVQVRNAGIGLLSVRAASEQPRVEVSPDETDVPTGPPVRFNLAIPVGGLAGGDHEIGVRFTSNGGDGRAAVRFRLPVEQLDAPALVDLGDRAAGRPTGDSVKVKNTGPDRLTLRVRGEHQWIRPGTDKLSIAPGETVSLPFRLDLPAGVFGPRVSTILLEGRAIRHAVAVRAVARKVDLVLVPGVVLLGDMNPGEERAFTIDVVNAGEIVAEVREAHASGDLEVWVRKATVRPGDRVTLAGRARVNTRQSGQQVRAMVPLAEEAAVRCVANVTRSLVPRIAAVAATVGGLVGGGAVSVALGWWLGVPLALSGIAVGAWLFWLDTR